MHRLVFTIGWLLCTSTVAFAQVSVSIGMPGVSIGINLPVYPQLVQVPGYPVYYAPQANANYFFYDGLYWVYANDNWYSSSWYNGPWQRVYPDAVPLYVLRVPVRYYRNPPSYFRGWRADVPPRWGEHWGSDWQRRHSGWNEWNRRAVPAPAPLPSYQRQFSGDRYPHPGQQQALQSRNYRYQPRDEVVRQHYEPPRASAPGPSTRGGRPAQTRPAPQRQGGEVPRQERHAPASQGGAKQRPQGTPQHVAPPPRSGQGGPRSEAGRRKQTPAGESPDRGSGLR